MSGTDKGSDEESMTPQQRALDAALLRSLSPPALPGAFQARWRQAMLHSLDRQIALRGQLQTEGVRMQRALRADLLRLRRTLLVLLALAFTAGAAVTVAMPWLIRSLGLVAEYIIPALFAAAALGVGLSSWARRMRITFRGPS